MASLKDKLLKGIFSFILGLTLAYSAKAEPLQFTSKTFDAQIKNSSQPVIAGFFDYADSDANLFIPKFKEFSDKYGKNFKIIQTDIMGEEHKNKNIVLKSFNHLRELCGNLLDKYQIRAPPSIAVYKDGKRLNLLEGAPNADVLHEWVRDTLKVDEIIKQPYTKNEQEKKKVRIAPDLETFLNEVSKWDNGNIYPILIDAKNKYTKKFIEAYGSEVEILNKEKIGKINEQKILNTLYAALGPEDLKSLKKNVTREELKKRIGNPEGIVLTNVKDKSLAGAIALAAGHNQLIDFIKINEKHDITVDSDRAKEIRGKVEKIIKSNGYEYKNFGNIDYVTIAADVPFKYQGEKRAGDDKYCLDDLISRDEENKKFAYTGRLIEISDKASLYQAICALFLQPKNVLGFDTYGNPFGEGYHTKDAMEKINHFMKTENIQNPGSTIEKWREMFKNGNKYDLIFVQSGGGPTDFGTASIKGNTNDVPDSVPAIVLFTHSNSAANPYDNSIISGRYLENGAFIYNGSLAEPKLQTANNPEFVTNKIILGKTISEAVQDRKLAIDSFNSDSAKGTTKPWRWVYIGDPMYKIK